MILFSPPNLDRLNQAFPNLVAQRKAYLSLGQSLYAPPGSDLKRGILSRSPLAALLFNASTTRGGIARSCGHHIRLPQGALACHAALQSVFAVTFQGQQMNARVATLKGNTPFSVTLSFNPIALVALREAVCKLRGPLTNLCFGGDATDESLIPLLYDFPIWHQIDLTFTLLPSNLGSLPCRELLNLILCCEVGYCPARLFQLLGFSASEVVDRLGPLSSNEADRRRKQLQGTFPALVPPPKPLKSPAHACTTYADLANFLRQSNLSRKDLALAAHIDLDLLSGKLSASSASFNAPLPQAIEELIDYALGHSHSDLREELLRRAGPDHACTLWTGEELRAFRKRYNLTQARLHELLPGEVLYLSQWENGAADIPLSTCKALDELQAAFRRGFPERQ